MGNKFIMLQRGEIKHGVVVVPANLKSYWTSQEDEYRDSGEVTVHGQPIFKHTNPEGDE